MTLRLKQLEADPSLQPWLLRTLVLHDRQVMIGHVLGDVWCPIIHQH